TGPLTEIQRIEFGGDPIPDGATVLVDYTVTQAQDAQFTEDRLVWSHRLEIDRFHVAPYLILQYFNQDLVSGDDPGNLNRTTSITLGIDYNHDGLFASYEFETLDSQISLSYDAHRLRGSYYRTFGRDVTLTLGADAEWLTYTNADAFGLEPGEDFRNTYHAFGQFTQRINKSTLWRVRVDGRDISGRQTTRHAEISSGLEWQYR